MTSDGADESVKMQSVSTSGTTFDGVKSFLGAETAAAVNRPARTQTLSDSALDADHTTLSSTASESAHAAGQENVRREKVASVRAALAAGTLQYPSASSGFKSRRCHAQKAEMDQSSEFGEAQVRPQLKTLLAEAAEALTSPKAERREDLAHTCQALNRDSSPETRRAPTCKLRASRSEMAALAKALEITRANVAVMERIRMMRTNRLEHAVVPKPESDLPDAAIN